ncbi:thioredoxin [Lacticaseibacillus daqingensis]|uniref:thioredoxin n=1 Tax=Lacticaseibacillus daqingensis TaxID=2486014 RepID=UPI000F795B7C|nr:thioredoxin [Lacticaseibacillus daqingensis]
MVEAVTDTTFEQETATGVTLTDFWATWCGPCRMQSPVIDALAETRKDVKFVKMDVDANPNTPQSFGIMAIPTLLVKKDGEAVEKIVGYHTKEQLSEILDKYTK